MKAAIVVLFIALAASGAAKAQTQQQLAASGFLTGKTYQDFVGTWNGEFCFNDNATTSHTSPSFFTLNIQSGGQATVTVSDVTAPSSRAYASEGMLTVDFPRNSMTLEFRFGYMKKLPAGWVEGAAFMQLTNGDVRGPNMFIAKSAGAESLQDFRAKYGNLCTDN